MVVPIISINTLQFQYFWDFNKCLQAISSQLSLENFQQYRLVARLFSLKIIKNYCKLPLKVCGLKGSELITHQMYSKILRQFSNRGLISISSESSKIHLLITVLYRSIWNELCRRYSLSHALNVSLGYQQQCNFTMSYYFLGLQT